MNAYAKSIVILGLSLALGQNALALRLNDKPYQVTPISLELESEKEPIAEKASTGKESYFLSYVKKAGAVILSVAMVENRFRKLNKDSNLRPSTVIRNATGYANSAASVVGSTLAKYTNIQPYLSYLYETLESLFPAEDLKVLTAEFTKMVVNPTAEIITSYMNYYQVDGRNLAYGTAGLGVAVGTAIAINKAYHNGYFEVAFTTAKERFEGAKAKWNESEDDKKDDSHNVTQESSIESEADLI